MPVLQCTGGQTGDDRARAGLHGSGCHWAEWWGSDRVGGRGGSGCGARALGVTAAGCGHCGTLRSDEAAEGPLECMHTPKSTDVGPQAAVPKRRR